MRILQENPQRMVLEEKQPFFFFISTIVGNIFAFIALPKLLSDSQIPDSWLTAAYCFFIISSILFLYKKTQTIRITLDKTTNQFILEKKRIFKYRKEYTLGSIQKIIIKSDRNSNELIFALFGQERIKIQEDPKIEIAKKIAWFIPVPFEEESSFF